MKNAAGQAVTMEHVLTYVTDELKVEVARKALWRYLIDHGFVYKLATPRDSLRIVSRENEIVSYYQNLENDLEGVHPSLVFNVDEMGAEMFADRKEVRVFVPPKTSPKTGTSTSVFPAHPGDAHWSLASRSTVSR